MSNAPTISHALARSGLVPLEAQVLLANTLLQNRAWLIAHGSDPLTQDQAEAFFALAHRRRKGEPIAYLTGVREFWGLPLAVSPAVMIPRPETETLVELALARLPSDHDTRVLDLGTGSGAIAVAIARERPRASVLAVDSSNRALAVATENVRRLGITNVELARSDWYEGIASIAQRGSFDLIASNPPYIRIGDPHLAAGDVRFEPQVALASGADGLSAIRRIIAGASAWLRPNGTLIIEHGYDQAQAVGELFADSGFTDIVGRRDLAGITRVVAGILPGP